MPLRFWCVLLATTCSTMTSAGERVPPPAFFRALQVADLRVATIGFRLATANAALCRDQAADLGVALQAADQFEGANRAAAAAVLGSSASVTIEGVVPGGPADRAGIKGGDALVAVAGRRLPANVPSGRPTAATRNAAEDMIAAQPAGQAVSIVVQRDGRELGLTAAPASSCRTGFEMLLDDDWTADSDGVHIRIGSRFLEREPDDAVAAVLAHELGHVVLRHRERLDAAGIDRGLLKEVGRNGRLLRRVEDEADEIGVVLLYNAGYDPRAAARFWQSGGPGGGGGLFRATYYRSAGDRARRTAATAAAIPTTASRPYSPALLATRDQPLD